MNLPKVDELAPQFTLLNQDGNAISLSDFLGKNHVVLYFYPRASTPGCTTQACGIRDYQKQFDKIATVVLGVSPDPVERIKKFVLKERLNFSLLSDEGHQVAEKYGVWGKKKFLGKSFDGIHRISFVIGKDGKIKKIFEKVQTKTHHADVYDWISANLP